jgi:hypothetical protein
MIVCLPLPRVCAPHASVQSRPDMRTHSFMHTVLNVMTGYIVYDIHARRFNVHVMRCDSSGVGMRRGWAAAMGEVCSKRSSLTRMHAAVCDRV